MMGSIIISFGVPKSGTTFVCRMFERINGESVTAARLREAVKLHPWYSDKGLKFLDRVFGHFYVNFFRTLRHPVDIIESRMNIFPQYLNDHCELHRMIDYYRAAYDNIDLQREYIKSQKKCTLIEVLYEKIGDEKYIAEKIAQLLGVSPLKKTMCLEFIKNFWNKVPVRDGKLKRGDKDFRLISDEWVEIIMKELYDIPKKYNIESRYQFLPHKKICVI